MTLARQRAAKTRSKPMPPKPVWKGYMTDEWAAYMSEVFRRMTPAEVNRACVEAGITDKKGNLTGETTSVCNRRNDVSVQQIDRETTSVCNKLIDVPPQMLWLNLWHLQSQADRRGRGFSLSSRWLARFGRHPTVPSSTRLKLETGMPTTEYTEYTES